MKRWYLLVAQFFIVLSGSYAQIPGGMDGFVAMVKKTSVSLSARTEAANAMKKFKPVGSNAALALLNGEVQLLAVSSDPISFDGIDGEFLEGVDGESLEGIDGESLVSISSDPITLSASQISVIAISAASATKPGLLSFRFGKPGALKAMTPLKGKVSSSAYSELRSALRQAGGSQGLVLIGFKN